MLTAVAILAAIAALLFVISLIPATSQWPLVSVAGLLLSIAVLLIGRT